jgi:O-acetyl-ADP-ribose deacetylase (regulator of RNase III)
LKAFPCIGTGVYGYPREAAARIALNTVRKFVEEQKNDVDRVVFVVFLEEDRVAYEDLMQIYFPVHHQQHVEQQRDELHLQQQRQQ